MYKNKTKDKKAKTNTMPLWTSLHSSATDHPGLFFPNYIVQDLNTTMLGKNKDSDHPQLVPCLISG